MLTRGISLVNGIDIIFQLVSSMFEAYKSVSANSFTVDYSKIELGPPQLN